MDIFERAKALEKETIENRRYLHANAETGFDLPKTNAFIKEKLREVGLEVTPCGKSLTATVGKGEKAFLLRADTDALPIAEETELPFACRSGNMHACGHDLHTAMLLSAGKILKERESLLKGKVKLLFQPAEEKLAGAKNAINAGVLRKPQIAGAMMLHVLTSLPLPSGTLIVSSPGVSACGADFFTISVFGKSCHGSNPHEGVDALSVCAQIVTALHHFSALEIPASSRTVLSLGKLHAGVAGNVIAGEGWIEGTLRTFDETLRKKIKTRLREIVEGIASSFKARAEIQFTSGCPPLVNDEKLSLSLLEKLRSVFGEEKVLASGELKGEVGGSEDFAYISQKVPSLMIGVCAGQKGKGYEYPLHHPQTRFDEKALVVGVTTLVYSAFTYFEESICPDVHTAKNDSRRK